jgi:putative membrane-bound dehydrogenase-like protein
MLSTRWFAAAAALAALTAVWTLHARQSPPFTPEAAAFVEAYVDAGGDKLTSWVRGESVSTPEAAARAFRPAPGFTMELVAAEPIVGQPVDLHFDDRGRLWVVQYLQYPFPAGVAINWYDQYLRARYTAVPAPPPGHVRGADKITVLEDGDGDGVFERHQDVITGLNITTSVLTGRGGVWVMTPPYLLFYRDTTGDGLPDGDPDVRLEGFGLEDTHSLANSLTWGPDGWLYGVHGSTSTATVDGLTFLGQAFWRYHPERDRFELVAEGGGNPWTLSFDRQGRAFTGDNGGDSRGFHLVPGGRYAKNFPKHGPFTRPHAFGHFPSMPHEGDTARFAMTSVVYEDGRLPGYEGQLISGMALTSRVQASRLVPDGSTFRTIDTETLVETADRSFRPVDMTVGPDGAIYIADWCDIRLDHTDPRDTWDKCGRIWRLRAAGASPMPPVQLAARTTPELVALLGDDRKWYRTQARRLLGDRGDRAIVPELGRTAAAARGARALEALWTLHQIDGMSAARARDLLDHPDSAVRVWALRLLEARAPLPASLRARLVQMAASERDAEVRSELAHVAARLDMDTALAVLGGLMARREDAADRYIPLRIWWALEEQITADTSAVLDWLEDDALWEAPIFAGHLAGRIARRLAAERGDRVAFARLDPDADWLRYASHPRSRMPGGKGDYTDWITNHTPEVSAGRLTQLARFFELAPSETHRDRLLDGARAGFDQGPAIDAPPARLVQVLDGWWREGVRTPALVQVAARLGHPEASRLARATGGTRGRAAPAPRAAAEAGREGFATHCAACHQTDGGGLDRLGAPLRNSAFVLGPEDRLIRLVLQGLQGEPSMPPMGTLEDAQLAAILTYVRGAWGHAASSVTADTVARVRQATRQRTGPWRREELR